MENQKNSRMWIILTLIAGVLFWGLFILNTFVLENTPEILKWLAVLAGICHIALQIRQIVVTGKQKKD